MAVQNKVPIIKVQNLLNNFFIINLQKNILYFYYIIYFYFVNPVAENNSYDRHVPSPASLRGAAF